MESSEIDLFLKLVSDENMTKEYPCCRGKKLIDQQLEALLSLERDDSIIIKPSDKGGILVILDHEKYIDMCPQLLKDKNSYATLKKDPTGAFKEELQDLVVDALDRGQISRDESHFVLIEYPTIATFYSLPKIHKGLVPLKGRPIVSGVRARPMPLELCAQYLG